MAPLSWPPSGRMSFEAFMEMALFHPEKGYYSRQIRDVGRGGDFSTCATLSPTLGRAVAAWILAWVKQEALPLRVLEIGAGDGSLARHIRAALPFWQRRRLEYHIVEASQPLRVIQRRKLGRRVRWHESPQAAMEACDGQVLVIHNELVDAFPVRVFRRGQLAWEELYLDFEAGKAPQESWQAPEKLPVSCAFEGDFEEGQRVEVLESYQRWLQSWTELWRSGHMLTIDYGDPMPRLYQRRPQGTLRGYLFHQVLTGHALYQNPGRQDLTADVNFSDLQDWGAALGLETESFQSQADFIRPFATDSEEDRYLLDECGPGREFKVLHQSRREEA